MKKTLLTLAILTYCQSGFTASDFTIHNDNTQKPNKQTQYNKNLLEVPISDSRSTLGQSGFISSTTRITREEITRSGVQSVDQLLQQLAGIHFSRNGGDAGLTSFYLRGAEADTTLVLLNNVRIQSLNTGFSSITDLPISSIERIEVIRGAQSSLYGSAAPGGIIKIFTTPEKQRSTMRLSQATSNHGGRETSIGSTGNIDNFLMFGHGSWSIREGTNACANTSACFLSAPENDLDGVEKLNGLLGFQFFSDFGASLQLSQLYNNSRNEFDGGFTNESETTQKVTNININQPFGHNHNLRFDFGQFNEYYQSFLDSNGSQTSTGSYGTDRYSTSMIHEIQIVDSVLLISGLDYDHSTIVNSNVFPKINRQSTGAFSELELALNETTIRIGARRDKYDEHQATTNTTQTNYATTGHLKLMLEITNQVSLKTGLGRNFNMPTFSELYYPGFGNAALGPETHVSQDIGLDFTHQNYNASLFFFRTKSKDLITYDSTIGAPRSIGKALIRGIEFSQTLDLQAFELGTNITYLNARNTSENTTETDLPRRPRLQFAGYTSFQTQNTITRLDMISSSKRYDDLANTTRVGGYTLFDLGMTHLLTQNLNLGIRIENLFNKKYQTAFGYNQPDRNIWIDLKYAIH